MTPPSPPPPPPPLPRSRAAFVPCSGESWRDPYPMYAALRDEDPLHHVQDGDYWVLSRFADVSAALRDPEVYSSRQGLTFTYGDMKAIGLDAATPMVMLDPPEHTDFRKLITKGYTPRRVAAVEPDIRRFVRARLDHLDELAEQSGKAEVDLISGLFKPLPSFVVARYLGVDEADRARFDDWTEQIVAANAQGDPLGATEAVSGLFGHFTQLIERRRAAPADDTVSDLIQVMGDDEASLLRILGFAFTMVAGGNDTTTGLLGTAAELLTAHPELRQALAARPEEVPRAVEEFLRLATPVQALARTVTRDVTLHGATVPAGRKVLLLYGSANRDPREFGPTADVPDTGRTHRQHAAFGFGPHHCLGAAAARLQARVALEELLTRFPEFTVDAARGTFAGGSFVRRYASLPGTLT
ncbi:cytochrome P450 [Streptomyces sp. NPDC059009]|uniref:cytochrome P450 n=1 Tax=Streptomyces sp. NPDC059009 TaxID=3346694 RepID=UPI00368C92F2